MDPVNSFLRFFTGFLVFISLSFGITYAVQKITTRQDAQRQTAAALQAMLAPAK